MIFIILELNWFWSRRGPLHCIASCLLSCRCRTRFGVRIAGVEGGSWRWSLKAEINGRGSVATVTANRADGDVGFGNADEEGEG